jgi:hypothetical protein
MVSWKIPSVDQNGGGTPMTQETPRTPCYVLDKVSGLLENPPFISMIFPTGKIFIH